MTDVEVLILGEIFFITFAYGDPVQKLQDQVCERLTRFGLVRNTHGLLFGI